MAKQYYRKNNSYTTDKKTEWINMSGSEFYLFIKSPEGKEHCFIDFEDFVIESTKEQYDAWRKEKDHSDYLRLYAQDIVIVSLFNDCFSENGGSENVIQDETVNIEETVVKKIQYKALGQALKELNLEDYALIHALYLTKECITERKLAEEYGVSQVAIHKWKKRILKKLNLLVIKFEKSSQ